MYNAIPQHCRSSSTGVSITLTRSCWFITTALIDETSWAQAVVWGPKTRPTGKLRSTIRACRRQWRASGHSWCEGLQGKTVLVPHSTRRTPAAVVAHRRRKPITGRGPHAHATHNVSNPGQLTHCRSCRLTRWPSQEAQGSQEVTVYSIERPEIWPGCAVSYRRQK